MQRVPPPRSSRSRRRQRGGDPWDAASPCRASLPRWRGVGRACPRRGTTTRAAAAMRCPRVQASSSPFSAELVQAWRSSVIAIGRGAIALDLIDAIERNVEPIPALVLDDRHLERALSGEDGVDAAVDTDAVLEVHDVIAGLECSHRLERNAARVATGAPQSPLAPEDFVIGQNPEGSGNHEAAAEHANSEVGGDGASSA